MVGIWAKTRTRSFYRKSTNRAIFFFWHQFEKTRIELASLTLEMRWEYGENRNRHWSKPKTEAFSYNDNQCGTPEMGQRVYPLELKCDSFMKHWYVKVGSQAALVNFLSSFFSSSSSSSSSSRVISWKSGKWKLTLLPSQTKVIYFYIYIFI